jgi:cysteinyl-tRNA synthetase
LDDDFNTPEALAAMHGWRDHDLLRRGLEVFGLESLAEVAEAPVELEELARARVEARNQKDFETSDRLRDEIEAAGWAVRDVDGEPGFQLVPKR